MGTQDILGILVVSGLRVRMNESNYIWEVLNWKVGEKEIH